MTDEELAEELAVDIHDRDDIARTLGVVRNKERSDIVNFGRMHEDMFLEKAATPGDDPETMALRLAASGARSALKLLLDAIERGAHLVP